MPTEIGNRVEKLMQEIELYAELYESYCKSSDLHLAYTARKKLNAQHTRLIMLLTKELSEK